MATPVYGALVFNWRDQTHSLRPMKGATAVALGRPSGAAGEVWDEAEGSWEDAALIWDIAGEEASRRAPLIASSDGIYQSETGTSPFAVAREVERLGISLPTNIQTQRPDVTGVKLIRAVYLKAEILVPDALELYVGGQYTAEGTVDWQGPFYPSFELDYKVDCTVAGRFLALRFRSTADAMWRLWSAEIDYEVIAKY